MLFAVYYGAGCYGTMYRATLHLKGGNSPRDAPVCPQPCHTLHMCLVLLYALLSQHSAEYCGHGVDMGKFSDTDISYTHCDNQICGLIEYCTHRET